MHVHFKQIKGTWYCFGTIAGYDYSFDGVTVDAAKLKMMDLLQKKKINPETVKWHEPY